MNKRELRMAENELEQTMGGTRVHVESFLTQARKGKNQKCDVCGKRYNNLKAHQITCRPKMPCGCADICKGHPTVTTH